MAFAFAGEYTVTEYYRDALRQIAGVLRDLPNEREYKDIDDERLVEHFLTQAIGASQEGGWELPPLQEMNARKSRSVVSELPISTGNTAISIPIMVVTMPLIPSHSNASALNIRSEQHWPQGTGIEKVASFRRQNNMIELRGRKDEISRLVRTAENMMNLINLDIERHTPEFRRQVLALIQERRRRIAQTAADLEQTRRELGIGDLPEMAPENPATVVVHDLYFRGGRLQSRRELVEASSTDTRVLNVGWEYEEQPPGYFPVGGGAIYVRETEGYFRVPSAGDPPLRATPTSLGDSRYRVREDTARGGTMVVLILPEGYTLVDPTPHPIEAKVFQDRITLFWRRAQDGESLEVVWKLRTVDRGLQEEVEQINSRTVVEKPVGPETRGNIAIERQETPDRQCSPRVFISYVSEDSELVNRLQRDLESAGVETWRDRNNLSPGMRWKSAIRRAIRDGAFFLACFSESSVLRNRSYMWEELLVAIEEMRRRPQDQTWFIPVKLSECDIPEMDVGAGNTLQDIHYSSLHRDWDGEMKKLLDVIKTRS